MRRQMRGFLLVGTLAVLMMGVVGGGFFWQEVKRVQAVRARPLPVYSQVPEFSLVERSGNPVSLSALAGRVWIVDFIFTHCAGPCPLLSAQMGTLQAPLAQMPDVRLVSVSVDPERDTPRLLSDYALRFGADKERWLFLTGEKAAVYRMIREGFQVAVEDDPKSDQIMHSLRFALVDRKGQVRAYYDGTDPELADKLLPDVKALLKEGL